MSSWPDEPFVIDPHLQAEAFAQFGSSQTTLPSSDGPGGFSLSSPVPSFASMESLSCAEALRVLGQIQSLARQQEEILGQLRRHEDLLKEMASKYDADDKGDGGETYRPKKKKKMSKKESGRILTEVNVRELTPEQQKVRSELLTHLEKQMKKLVGVQENENVPQNTNSVRDCDDESVLPDSETVHGDDEVYIAEFGKEVGNGNNKRLIQQAAYLVFKHQTDPELRRLTYEDVPFSAKDIEELSKDPFRFWKKAHEDKENPEKKKRKEDLLKRGMRRQRKRQKKIDRGKSVPTYKLTHGNVQAGKLLHTDWMSDELSCRSDLEADDERKKDYQNEKLVKAGYSLDAKGMEVWETVRPAFRSAEVNALYNELDEITEKQKSKKRAKKPTVKRVYLGRMNYEIPELAPYPFMVNQTWKCIYVDAKGRKDKFEMRSCDPKGFGTRFGEVGSGADERD
ncbi:hypothetical protein ACEPAI_4561 [Sanghuangporus weigelae]